MDQQSEECKTPMRDVAQQYEEQRRNYAALVQAAQLIPTAINQRYAKQQWCKAAIQFLKSGEGR